MHKDAIDPFKRLEEVLDGLEKIKARIDTLEMDVGEIRAAIGTQMEEINELLPNEIFPEGYDEETGITAEQQAEMGWPMKGEPEPYDEPPK